ncbi:uncharacterized protein PG998_014644 [Apiospora kogelbergensis]|uniref:uncharacterized protein n=1 Tax=Apiospora kogelbergensis TaxID=1337665 RepID=UPI0031326650
MPTPGLFCYAQGMPVVVTRNLHVGLKLVNGAPFIAVDVVPGPVYASIAVASDVTFHLDTPLAVLLQSDAIAERAIPGLPRARSCSAVRRWPYPRPWGNGGPRPSASQARLSVGDAPDGAAVHAGVRRDRPEEPEEAVRRGATEPQGCTPRDRHGAAAQLHKLVHAIIKGDTVGRPVPLPGAGAVGIHRIEGVGQRHEERRGAAGEARGRDEGALPAGTRAGELVRCMRRDRARNRGGRAQEGNR